MPKPMPIETDLRGLDDRTLISRLKKKLRQLYPGQFLHVVTADKGPVTAITELCHRTGDVFLVSKYKGDNLFHIIQKQPQI